MINNGDKPRTFQKNNGFKKGYEKKEVQVIEEDAPNYESEIQRLKRKYEELVKKATHKKKTPPQKRRIVESDDNSDESVMVMETIEEKIPKKRKKEPAFKYRTTFKTGREREQYHKARIEYEASLEEEEEDSDEEFLTKVKKEQRKLERSE